MRDFDELRAVVAGGDGAGLVAGGDGAGVVVRLPGLLAVAQGPDPAVLRLLELCRECAGPTPGRALARRLTAWLGSDDELADQLRFGTLAAAERGLAVFLHGTVDLLVPDRGTAIVGADAATWTDRLIDAPDAPVALTLQGATAPADLLDSVYDLWEGVVPGVAVVAVVAGAAPSEPVMPAEQVEPAEPLKPVEPVMPAEPDRTEVLRSIAGGDAPPERPRIPPPARAEAAQRGEGPPMAEGYLCARGHLNDPSSHFCVLCGIRMNELTGVLVVAERPPLGLLVFDDGVTHTVDSGFLLGREPDGDARVRAGVLRPIVLEDRSGAMSRVHAEIRLENWDVVLTDSGSSNGTFVAEPGSGTWTPLLPGRPFRLLPGARVRLGQRTFTFETPSGVR